MAPGYPCFSTLPIDSALWHSGVNEIIVSSMSASLMFYFTRVHIASLHLQGFAFKAGGREDLSHLQVPVTASERPSLIQLDYILGMMMTQTRMETMSFFRPFVSLLMTAVNYTVHASAHWWRQTQNWAPSHSPVYGPSFTLNTDVSLSFHKRCTSAVDAVESEQDNFSQQNWKHSQNGPHLVHSGLFEFCILFCREYTDWTEV